MSEKELLKHWLINMYSGLQNANKEIQELENKKEFYKELHEFQLNKLDRWSASESLEEDLKEELNYWRDFVEGMPEEDERKLRRLKKNRDASVFIIDKIEKELRD